MSSHPDAKAKVMLGGRCATRRTGQPAASEPTSANILAYRARWTERPVWKKTLDAYRQGVEAT